MLDISESGKNFTLSFVSSRSFLCYEKANLRLSACLLFVLKVGNLFPDKSDSLIILADASVTVGTFFSLFILKKSAATLALCELPALGPLL